MVQRPAAYAVLVAGVAQHAFGAAQDALAANYFGPIPSGTTVTVTPDKTVKGARFTLYMPVSRPVRADPRNIGPGYPADALEWNVKLLFQYMVDENGRAMPGTATVLGADNTVWESDRQRQAYERFRRQVELALPAMRFTPAELNGCYIRAMVQQQFVFTHNQ